MFGFGCGDREGKVSFEDMQNGVTELYERMKDQ